MSSFYHDHQRSIQRCRLSRQLRVLTLVLGRREGGGEERERASEREREGKRERESEKEKERE